MNLNLDINESKGNDNNRLRIIICKSYKIKIT